MPRYVPCKNPGCQRLVKTDFRPRNREGRNSYCSVECYAAWPPSMREVASLLGLETPLDFLDALRELKKKPGLKTASTVLGISQSQILQWIDRLERIYEKV